MTSSRANSRTTRTEINDLCIFKDVCYISIQKLQQLRDHSWLMVLNTLRFAEGSGVFSVPDMKADKKSRSSTTNMTYVRSLKLSYSDRNRTIDSNTYLTRIAPFGRSSSFITSEIYLRNVSGPVSGHSWIVCLIGMYSMIIAHLKTELKYTGGVM